MKKYLLLSCYVTLMLIVTVGCTLRNEENDNMNTTTYEQISQTDAKKLMESETDYIIIDARTEEEYKEGHIPNAICIPNEAIDETVNDVLTNKNQLILVYCRSGVRSKQAASKLVSLGFTNIKEFGGIITWQYETTK